MTSRMLVTIALITPLTVCQAGSFLKPVQRLSTVDAEKSLVSELAGAISEERLAVLEDALRTTYQSLPKDVDGHLGHQAVRYVLHRLFVQRHSWYIRGLEPSDEVPPPYLGGEWVPAYLQGLLEQRFGERGINLHELAALAAALEDLVHKEAAMHLVSVYQLHNVSATDLVDSKTISEILSTFMMMYLRDGNFTSFASEDLAKEKEWFATNYEDYPAVEEFLHDIQKRHTNVSYDGAVTFTKMASMVGDLSERFGFFNDRECSNLKSTLMEIEDPTLVGRVRLSDFYKKGLYSHWEFNEKIGYLRAIGALDESDPSQARVIVPNYLTSRSNCLEASNLYAVCCRNECEDLMGNLESEIAAPTGRVSRIIELVSNLQTGTVMAPRNLSMSLQIRLEEIADANRGQIPVHGRLFAQWMHHAFPRECPYPHESGTVSPQTPDEWMKDTGDENHRASEEEIQAHVGNATYVVVEPLAKELELPWSNVEEHFAYRHALPTKVPNRSASLPFTLQLLVSMILMIGSVYWARQRMYHSAALGFEKPCATRDPEADVRAFLVLCTIIAAANSAGLLHKAAFGCTLYGGFVLVALPRISQSRPLSLKPESCRV